MMEEEVVKNNDVKTEIHRSVERYIRELNMETFIFKADNFIVRYFGLETDWVEVSAGIKMKKYKCTVDGYTFLSKDDELIFIVDDASKNITFMSNDFETLMVFLFSKSIPEVSINEDVMDNHVHMLVFLSTMMQDIFSGIKEVET